MDWLEEYGRAIKYGIILFIVVVGGFQRWLVNRKEKKTQETIDVFDLVGLYRKTYLRAYSPDDDDINEAEYIAAAENSEQAYRIQMGGHLQQYFSFKQMFAAIEQRRVNAIYDGEDILQGMMLTAKVKATENINQIKASLGRNTPDGKSTRRRRRR